VAEGTLRARVALSGRGWLSWPLGLLLLLVLILVLAITARLKLSSLGELVLVAAGGGTSFLVPAQGATIGSAADNTVVVVDRRVSRRHALLKRRGKDLILTDLRSTNGTQVNGQTVRTATIRDGDHILLGGAVELVYRRQARRR
jgi:pSer/pThr/pTyr-binding forkhead associated (FHA) protein